MDFIDCFKTNNSILMEGALGERLKREYHLHFDEHIAMASLIYTESGRQALKELWIGYANIAKQYHLPFMATTPTRRSNIERVDTSAFSHSIIKDNVSFLREIQKEIDFPMYVGALIGCKGDAYTAQGALSTKEAIQFHQWQIQQCIEAKVDFIFAAIMPSLPEILGMVQLLQNSKIPYIISFTIQKDGCLIDGTSIRDAIETIDASTANPPICYMANCVHPDIVYEALSQPFNNNELVHTRFCGIQANTSPLAYAELDNAVDLKTSDPLELADSMMKIKNILPLKIFGGCCGTDFTHMEEIAKKIK